MCLGKSLVKRGRWSEVDQTPGLVAFQVVDQCVGRTEFSDMVAFQDGQWLR